MWARKRSPVCVARVTGYSQISAAFLRFSGWGQHSKPAAAQATSQGHWETFNSLRIHLSESLVLTHRHGKKTKKSFKMEEVCAHQNPQMLHRRDFCSWQSRKFHIHRICFSKHWTNSLTYRFWISWGATNPCNPFRQAVHVFLLQTTSQPVEGCPSPHPFTRTGRASGKPDGGRGGWLFPVISFTP